MSDELDPTLLPPDLGALELPPVPDDFGFGEDHQLLMSSARRWLEERCPMSVVRRSAEPGARPDPALWRDLAELGWLAVTDADRRAGAGLGRLHVALLLEAMGRALLPEPYLSSLLALEAIERAGSAAQRAALCPAIVDGTTRATLAVSEPGASWEPAHVTTRATQTSDGWLLQGVKTHVLFGADSELLIVPARETGGALSLFAVPAKTEGVRIRPEVAVDTTRPTARILLEGVRVGADAQLEADGLDALEAVYTVGYALLASEMVGAADAVLEKTRSYAIDRHQFGRAIGSFQAVKHPLVDMLVGVEHARSLALGAMALLESGPREAVVIARMAKALANDVLAFAVKKGVQLHGGFGFTWDCDVHFYFKRMLWSRGTLGDSHHHRRHLAARLFGAAS